MINKLFALIFKIALSILWILFVNNPISPLSVPVLKKGELQWYPLLAGPKLEHYQFIFTMLAVFGLIIVILEFLWQNNGGLCQVANDILSIGTLVVVRGIPKEALNFTEDVLLKYYQGFYWFINVLILLTMVSGVLKLFNYVAKGRSTP